MNDVTIPAPTQQPIERDLVREIAMDVGKEVAAYIERQYPKAVEATSSTFLLSVRNTVCNQILAALAVTDPAEIERRLKMRSQERRKLRASYKAMKDIQPGEHEKAQAILDGRVFLEPDL